MCANNHKLSFSDIKASLVCSEPEINAFQFSIDLGLSNKEESVLHRKRKSDWRLVNKSSQLIFCLYLSF